MALDVLTWNVGDALSDLERAAEVERVVLQPSLDVIALQEGYEPGKEAGLDSLQTHAHAAGLRVIAVPYDDPDGRKDIHGMAVLVRPELLAEPPEIFRLGTTPAERVQGVGRVAIRLTVWVDGRLSPGVNSSERMMDIYAVHGGDRSEATRSAQQEVLLADVAQRAEANPGRAVAIVGDFNAQDLSAPGAAFFRRVGSVAQADGLPYVEPGTARPARPESLNPFAWLGFAREWAAHKAGRAVSFARRLGEMSLGTVMQRFGEAGFQEAAHGPTKLFSPKIPIPLATLDHIIMRGRVQPTVEVMPPAAGSDHLAVRAHIT